MIQFPINLTLYGFTIDTHLVAEGLAFFIGFRYFLYLRRNTTDTISMSNRISILIGAALGAFVGSRLVGSLENPAGFDPNNWEATVGHIFGNRTILGGLLGGIFGVELCKKIIGESHSSGDLFTYPILLGMIIGRIGCFSMGVYESTYGNVTTFFTGMDLGDGLLRHPIMLYEIAFCVLLWLLLWGLSQRYVWVAGGKFKAFMLAYLFFRLFTEFLKPKMNLVGELNAVQLACCVGVGYYVWGFWKSRKGVFER